jgi:hypothetical protein
MARAIGCTQILAAQLQIVASMFHALCPICHAAIGPTNHCHGCRGRFERSDSKIIKFAHRKRPEFFRREPVWLPPHAVFYGYTSVLRHLFLQLRPSDDPQGAAVQRLKNFAQVPDLLRCWDDAVDRKVRMQFSDDVALLADRISAASNEMILGPSIPRLSLFHGYLDFLHLILWKLQNDSLQVRGLGTLLHNLPDMLSGAYDPDPNGMRVELGEYGSAALTSDFNRCLRGELPSPIRVRIREVLRDPKRYVDHDRESGASLREQAVAALWETVTSQRVNDPRTPSLDPRIVAE